ncbi:hypothetical protein K525DRAFT_275378 [Schizophyllum commune Loenen D]|nr:hypothetical protein K525DRAFT_275378 [Schizophyllum commune Loenen D]
MGDSRDITDESKRTWAPHPGQTQEKDYLHAEDDSHAYNSLNGSPYQHAYDHPHAYHNPRPSHHSHSYTTLPPMLPATHARLGYAAVAVGRSSVSRSALSASGALLAAGRSTVAASGRSSATASTSSRSLTTAARPALRVGPTARPATSSHDLVQRRFMSSGSKSRYDVGVFTLPSAAVFVATGLGLVLYFRHEKQKLEEERGEWKSLTCVD